MKIELTGSRRADEALANKAAGSRSATAASGVPVVLLLGQHRGEVWYSDIEDDSEDRARVDWFDRRGVWKLSDSFAEFMAGLRPLEDDAGAKLIALTLADRGERSMSPRPAPAAPLAAAAIAAVEVLADRAGRRRDRRGFFARSVEWPGIRRSFSA